MYYGGLFNGDYGLDACFVSSYQGEYLVDGLETFD